MKKIVPPILLLSIFLLGCENPKNVQKEKSEEEIPGTGIYQISIGDTKSGPLVIRYDEYKGKAWLLDIEKKIWVKIKEEGIPTKTEKDPPGLFERK